MELTHEFDVITAAAEIVDGKLGILEALGEANKYRIEEGSRLICRCLSCRGENSHLIGWLYDMRQPERPDPVAERIAVMDRARRN